MNAMPALDHTHDPAARSWVAAANADGTDFPIQNRPFASFRRAASGEPLRGGVAIGEQVLDLRALADAGLLHGSAQQALACRTNLPFNKRAAGSV